MAHHRASLGVCNGRLSAEHRAALHGLAQGLLSAEDRASLRLLSQRVLSEDTACLNSLRQMTAEDGTVTGPEPTHLKAISLRCLLACDGTIMTTTWQVMRDRVVGRAQDVVVSMQTIMAEFGLGEFQGGWTRR